MIVEKPGNPVQFSSLLPLASSVMGLRFLREPNRNQNRTVIRQNSISTLAGTMGAKAFDVGLEATLTATSILGGVKVPGAAALGRAEVAAGEGATTFLHGAPLAAVEDIAANGGRRNQRRGEFDIEIVAPAERPVELGRRRALFGERHSNLA